MSADEPGDRAGTSAFVEAEITASYGRVEAAVEQLVHTIRERPGDNPDFTSLSTALLLFESAGDKLATTVRDWSTR